MLILYFECLIFLHLCFYSLFLPFMSLISDYFVVLIESNFFFIVIVIRIRFIFLFSNLFPGLSPRRLRSIDLDK